MDDTRPPHDSDGITHTQQIVGTLLHYSRAVDNTMLVSLSYLTAAQTTSTDKTAFALTKLLNYASTHTNATLHYVASDMILHIYSDVSYGSEPKSRIRAGGLFKLTSRAADPTKPPIATPTHNGAIHTISNIMRNVMLSATEAEAGGLFHKEKYGVTLRITLSEMVHPQPATPIQTDNTTLPASQTEMSSKENQKRWT